MVEQNAPEHDPIECAYTASLAEQLIRRLEEELAVYRTAMPAFSALYGGHRDVLTREAQRKCHSALTYPRPPLGKVS